MSLRTRLILAFILLSVVPNSVVTLYSYSRTANRHRRPRHDLDLGRNDRAPRRSPAARS
jgi:hypothetical protein